MKKLLLLAAIGGLLAGCQSERVAFQFQPATAVAVVAPAVNREPASAATDTTAQTAAPSTATAQAARTQHSTIQTPIGHSSVALRPSSLADTKVAKLLKPRLLPRLALRHHAKGETAENGLENIGYFALAVLLGIIAGLAALVSLIPGVTFWAGVGYVVAGLVVAFLLFKLFHKPAVSKQKTVKTTTK